MSKDKIIKSTLPIKSTISLPSAWSLNTTVQITQLPSKLEHFESLPWYQITIVYDHTRFEFPRKSSSSNLFAWDNRYFIHRRLCNYTAAFQIAKNELKFDVDHTNQDQSKSDCPWIWSWCHQWYYNYWRSGKYIKEIIFSSRCKFIKQFNVNFLRSIHW